MSPENCVDLIELANRLCLPHLVTLVEKSVVQQMTELREEGVDLSEVSLAIFEECQIHSANQVWSLAQFYSVDLSPSEIRVNKCVHNKRTIKVCVRCF